MKNVMDNSAALAEVLARKAELDAQAAQLEPRNDGLKVYAADPPPPRPEEAESKPSAAEIDLLRADGMGFNVAECADEVIPPTTWRVESLVSEHLTILAGKSGCGKSWLALEIACGVATGGKVAGHYKCEQGKVLYLALEDNKRRIMDRIRKLGVDAHSLANLDVRLEIPLAAQGGMEWLESYITANPNTNLIIIDVLACFRGISRPGNIYEVQYEDLRVYREFARRHDVSLLLVTHTTKARAMEEIKDPLDLITGSTAMRGAANMKIAMYDATNIPNAHILHRQCKDLEREEERDIVLTRDGAKFMYHGLREELDISLAQSEIIDAMKNQGAQTAKQLAEILGGKTNTYTFHLRKMLEKGIVRQIGIGRYIVV